MEKKEQAEKLFMKSMAKELELGPESICQLAKSIRKLIRDSLSKIDRNWRFKYKEFWMVIQKTAEKGKLIPEKAAEAFENLEKYFILLYKAPWKKEFRKLKTYCGFFQSRIRSHLEDPESIICIVGFRPEGTGTLVLRDDPDPELILSVAFECVVATVECEMISEFHRRMKEGGASVADVVRWMDTGEMPDLKKTKTQDNASSKHFSDSITTDSAYVSTNQGNTGVKNKSVVLGAEGGIARSLPYIDEDDHVVDDTGYVEGTVDEHYMASLQWLNKSESEPPRETSENNSEDWSYVRNSLKNRYGPGYYDGVRGDVIRIPREDIRVRNNEELSDEGIDIGEEPPPVNIQHPPVRIEQVPFPRSLVSQDRTLGRESSGYRTGTSTSQVFYPPGTAPLGQTYQSSPSSPGVISSDSSAYVSQGSFRQPIVARGVNADTGYPNIDRMARKPDVIQTDRHNYKERGATAELMARNMRDLGVTGSREWQCSCCTLINRGHVLICEGCGKSKDGRPEVDGPQCGDSITVCKKCTFENEPGIQICSMCGNPLDRSNLHTFV